MTRQPQRACHDSLFDEAELDQVLAVQSNQPSIQSIQGRSQVQADGLIRALRCIPDATNNLAERELRPMVLMRKNSNGSNTFTGMETSAIVASVVQTIAKRDAPALSSLLHPFNKASRTSLPSIDMRAPLTPPSSAFDQS